MEFIVRKHQKEEFYQFFCKFLDSHGFPLIKQEILPNNVFVCYAEEIPIYSVWVYFTDSKLAWIAFPASNKNVNYKKKIGGLDFLLDYVSRYAKRKGIMTLFTTSGTDAVIESLNNTGFEKGDSGVSHFIKKIQ